MDIVTYALCRKVISTAIATLGNVFTLKGNVDSVDNLPSTGNKPGDIYLVGPNQDGSYDEYYWTSNNTWETLGTSIDFGNVITEEQMYKGVDGTGTVQSPAQDTILAVVNGQHVLKTGDTMTGALINTASMTIGSRVQDSVVGPASVTVGSSNIASGAYSVATGYRTQATSAESHAEGSNSHANGEGSHAEGTGTIAGGRSQHVAGEYNVEEPETEAQERGTYAYILGNGENNNNRSNAHTITWDGDAWFAGDIYIGSTSGTQQDAGSKKVITEDIISNAITSQEINNIFAIEVF